MDELRLGVVDAVRLTDAVGDGDSVAVDCRDTDGEPDPIIDAVVDGDGVNDSLDDKEDVRVLEAVADPSTE